MLVSSSAFNALFVMNRASFCPPDYDTSTLLQSIKERMKLAIKL